MKIIKHLIILAICFLCLPLSLNAASNYEDVLGPKINNVTNDVTLYLFHLEGCPHCAEERRYLENIKKDYPNLKVVEYECSTDTDKYNIAVSHFGVAPSGFPFTVLGDQYYFGFNDSVKDNINAQLKLYFDSEIGPNEESKTQKFKKQYTIPILGKVNVKSVSIPIITVILGAVDGFNPCAMWILLFLLSILINQKDRKKMIVIGSIFIFTSGLIYYLAIMGINLFLNLINIKYLQVALGIVALCVGLYNIYRFIKTYKDNGCTVVNDKRRKGLLSKMNRILGASNMLLLVIGVIALAISVNSLELACSLGFPTIFSEILAINNIHGITRLLYILLYTVIYMTDDIIIFIIAVSTMRLVGTSNRIGKYVKLVAALIMILVGVLLIWFPKIIMLNF